MQDGPWYLSQSAMTRRRKTLLTALGAILLLGGALAARLYTWGRPLAKAYKLIEVTPAGAGGGRSFTYLALGGARSPGHRVAAIDNDGDGTVDVVAREGPLESFNRPATDDPEARWLVLCVDGVPFEEFAALWQEGHFREFFRPVPLVPPFPTASGVALTSVFHAEPVAGYEDAYFDIQRNRLSGGALKTTALADIPYVQLLDYDLPGLFRGLAYVFPRKSYRADLGRFRKRLLASQAKIFLAHIATTDSLYHIRPREELRALLLELEAVLRELYFDSDGKLRITFFSDHGSSLVPGRPVPLREHLAARGWRLGTQCGNPQELVVPAYGLLGYFAVYCAGEAKAAVARHLAQMEGVDVVVYADGDGVVVENIEGSARLEWNSEGTAFRYRMDEGDPLALGEILERFEREGKSDADGWVADADWFAATAAHRYPDAPRRLRQWALNHVVNRADVMVTLKPGYHQGTNAFEWIVTMLGTHGALDREQSLGFATSTDAPLEGMIRSEDLLPAELGKRR
jgi:hypothetical protein